MRARLQPPPPPPKKDEVKHPRCVEVTLLQCCLCSLIPHTKIEHPVRVGDPV